MNYFVFQVSDQSNYGRQRSAAEVFGFLVKDRSAWGFGHRTPNRKIIAPGDKVLFYLTGSTNQVFVGTATLKSGAYEDDSGESADWYLDPDTLRIDLEGVSVFPEPKSRKAFKSLEWQPVQGGASKISERDFNVVIGATPDTPPAATEEDWEMEFALEKYLEEFIVHNWNKVDFGEKLVQFEDENGNKGRQYVTDVGQIDILAKDENGGFVVIELKKGRKNDEVIGQILRYMGWVRKNLAKNGEEVRGLIIVGERHNQLDYALPEAANVAAKLYKADFKLSEY